MKCEQFMWNRKIFIDGKCGTVEGSGATSSNKLLECFLQSRWLKYGPVDTKNTKYFKKVKKKTRPKCIAIYANGHSDPCDKWVKNQLFVSTGHQVHQVHQVKGLGLHGAPQYFFLEKIPQYKYYDTWS